jgi:hypothetical protein
MTVWVMYATLVLFIPGEPVTEQVISLGVYNTKEQ